MTLWKWCWGLSRVFLNYHFLDYMCSYWASKCFYLIHFFFSDEIQFLAHKLKAYVQAFKSRRTRTRPRYFPVSILQGYVLWFVQELCFGIFTVSLIMEQNCTYYVNLSQFFLVVTGRLHFGIVLYNSTFLSSRISRSWVAHSYCPLQGSEAVCQENSTPVNVYGTIFICRLGILDLNQMPFAFFCFSSNGEH